jgi:hypothetical protein
MDGVRQRTHPFDPALQVINIRVDRFCRLRAAAFGS